jgi:YHS domain-containing protein
LEETIMARDPVCGMEVKPNNALKSVYNGQTYYFCRANCKHEFDQDPQRFVKQQPAQAQRR